MLFLALLLISAGRVQSLRCIPSSSSRYIVDVRPASRSSRLYVADFDEIRDVSRLSRTQLQALSKAYGLKATGTNEDLMSRLNEAAALKDASTVRLEEPDVVDTPVKKTAAVASSKGW